MSFVTDAERLKIVKILNAFNENVLQNLKIMVK